MPTSPSMIDWSAARDMFRRAFRSSLHFSIATVDEDGLPHVSPIGSVLLTEPGHGIFFDMFTSQLGQNLEVDPRVCVLAVDSGKFFWLKSLARGRFAAPPALRLVGTAGPLRPATKAEQERWLRRVRPVRRLVGHGLLWGDFSQVRDLDFHRAIPVHLGATTRHLGHPMVPAVRGDGID
ncbi:MAG: pyridoxamine 5'-phosphate oxidase family protein [Actinomycetota bacterium]|nr:pyridoxamine 5'-phosphate oxidase family protein [Actinomycetota bacterium]